MSEGGGGHHEIVIVKHGHGDHDDGHHGGAWKIAFADFMTAMMCFFLVMWLINASNDKTKAAVASYFNPVKLMDRNATRKGLEDAGDGPQPTGSKKDKAEAKKDGEAPPSPPQGAETNRVSADGTLDDQKLFADPYAVLAQIAAGEKIQPNTSTKGEGGAQEAGPATGASGGDAYRDPFAPDFWQQQVAAPSAAEATAIVEAAQKQQESAAKMDGPTPEEQAAMAPPGSEMAASDPFAPGASEVEAKADAKGASEAEQAAVEELAKIEELQAKPEKPAKKQDQKKSKQAKTEAEAKAKAEAKAEEEAASEEKPAADKPSEAAIRAADKIRQELADALLPGDPLRNGISVVATPEGVKVSVTDQLDFGMYEIGSALPRRELVLAMEKISKAIAAQKGDVTISGHTDARPFKGGGYDNWRLSSARAQSAYYMLVRAGLAEQRVTQVAGFADRKLKDPADPLAASNRRIEILLEIPQ